MLQDLNCLIERYLEPLKEETFLSGDDIQQLFGNIREIVQFQRLFLQSLEDAVIIDPDLNIVDNPKHFTVSSLQALHPCVFIVHLSGLMHIVALKRNRVRRS